MFQDINSQTSMSSQNCKLRPCMEDLTGKDISSNNVNHPLPSRQISSHTERVEGHLFTQIPKIQNTVYTVGNWIKGLSIKGAFN